MAGAVALEMLWEGGSAFIDRVVEGPKLQCRSGVRQISRDPNPDPAPDPESRVSRLGRSFTCHPRQNPVRNVDFSVLHLAQKQHLRRMNALCAAGEADSTMMST